MAKSKRHMEKCLKRKPVFKELDRYEDEGGNIRHKCVIIFKHKNKKTGECESVWCGRDKDGLPDPTSTVKFDTPYQAKEAWQAYKAKKKAEEKEKDKKKKRQQQLTK